MRTFLIVSLILGGLTWLHVYLVFNGYHLAANMLFGFALGYAIGTQLFVFWERKTLRKVAMDAYKRMQEKYGD